MSIPQIVLSVVVLLTSLFLIAVVLLQSGKSNGLSGAFGGSFDTYLGTTREPLFADYAFHRFWS